MLETRIIILNGQLDENSSYKASSLQCLSHGNARFFMVVQPIGVGFFYKCKKKKTFGLILVGGCLETHMF